VDSELAHNIGAVGLRCLQADAEKRSNFLAAFSFRKQLNDFALARGEPLLGNLRSVALAI
jgi:hypothetical protein